MDSKLFRKKSIEKFSSPEQLNDYIRVSNPGIWMTLIAVILLLAGVCVWGIFGTLDTKLPVVAVVENGQMKCYVREEDAKSVMADIPVQVEEKEYYVDSISDAPEQLMGEEESYFFHLSGFGNGDWAYCVTIGTVDLPDGIYQAELIIDRVSPMSFVTN